MHSDKAASMRQVAVESEYERRGQRKGESMRIGWSGFVAPSRANIYANQGYRFMRNVYLSRVASICNWSLNSMSDRNCMRK